MKRFFIALSVALAISFSAAAQQITRFGVVDTAKVYQAYFRTSAPMRSYDSKKAEAQKEISKRTEEIRRKCGYGDGENRRNLPCRVHRKKVPSIFFIC